MTNLRISVNKSLSKLCIMHTSQFNKKMFPEQDLIHHTNFHFLYKSQFAIQVSQFTIQVSICYIQVFMHPRPPGSHIGIDS